MVSTRAPALTKNGETIAMRLRRCCSATALVFAGIVAGLGTVASAATFELEDQTAANIKDDTGGASTAAVDWASLFDVPAAEQTNPPGGTDGVTPTPKSTLPTGVLVASFFRDFLIGSNVDRTAFTTGTKDIQNISGGNVISGQWQCVRKQNVSDKGDVLNAYAAIYRHTATNDVMIAFGVERSGSEGTSKVGFWFLQDSTVDCVASSGSAQTFTGNHMDGDLLVVIDFAQGGNNPHPLVFQWQGDAATGSLQELDIGGTTCTVGTSEDCATTNASQTLLHSDGGVPWLTQAKSGGGTNSPDLSPLRFFEGQINLTANNLQRCFTRYMANTRQSTSTSATVFDYVVGDFQVCGMTATKSCTAGTVTNGTDVNYTFNVNVANTGIAPISNVAITESVQGCSVATHPTTIAAGASIDVAVTCNDVGIGFENQAQVTATDEDGNPLTSVSVSADPDDFGACALAPTSDITIAADCDEVHLKTFSGLLGFEATVDVTVNPPAAGPNVEALNNVVVDVYPLSCTGSVSLCDSDGDPNNNKITTIQVTSGPFSSGDTPIVVSHTYDVRPADNASTSECAADALFTRRYLAHGTGAVSQTTVYFSSLVNGTPIAQALGECRPCIDCSNGP
jgi:hypothetical protein